MVSTTTGVNTWFIYIYIYKYHISLLSNVTSVSVMINYKHLYVKKRIKYSENKTDNKWWQKKKTVKIIYGPPQKSFSYSSLYSQKAYLNKSEDVFTLLWKKKVNACVFSTPVHVVCLHGCLSCTELLEFLTFMGSTMTERWLKTLNFPEQ